MAGNAACAQGRPWRGEDLERGRRGNQKEARRVGGPARRSLENAYRCKRPSAGSEGSVHRYTTQKPISRPEAINASMAPIERPSTLHLFGKLMNRENAVVAKRKAPASAPPAHSHMRAA